MTDHGTTTEADAATADRNRHAYSAREEAYGLDAPTRAEAEADE